MERMICGSLSADISPLGAELCSLRSEETGVEYIWQADPSIWAGHAPVLFPVVATQKQGWYEWAGERHEMPAHGFARNQTFDLLERHPDRLLFALTDNPDTRALYPFAFSFQIEHSLDAHGLTTRLRVFNRGEVPLPFCIGMHAGFRAPLWPHEAYSDYELVFEQAETAPRYPLRDRLLRAPEPYLAGQDRLPLSDTLFDDGALVFRDLLSRSATLRSRNHPHGIRLRWSGFECLGVWAMPRAPYVCIEPWSGLPSAEGDGQSLLQKPYLHLLPPDQSESFEHRIEVY